MYNPINLNGATVLVTGASSGIGRATAIVLSRLGVRLLLVGRRLDALEDTRSGCDCAGAHLCCPYDLSNLEGIPAWIKQLVAEASVHLDGIVHCAGVSGHVPLRAISVAHMDSMVRINVHSAIMLLKAASSKNVVPSTGSAVVLISSAAALVASAGMVTYSSSKAALHSVARTASKELASKRVRVNCIAPAYVRTSIFEKAADSIAGFQSIEQQQFLGIIDPEEVGIMAAYLLSPAARHVVGSEFVMDGGFTL